MSTAGFLAYTLFPSEPFILGLGKDALDLLNRLSTNDLRRLDRSGHTMTVLVDEKGRMIDVLTVSLEENRLRIVPSPGNVKPVISWLERFIFLEDARFEESELPIVRARIFRLSGQESNNSPEEKTTNPLNWNDFQRSMNKQMKAMLFVDASRGDLAEVFISAESISEFETAMEGCEAVSLTASEFEQQRVIVGIPAFPNEINQDHNPLEAGLHALISESKGCYIGQEVLARSLTYDKVQRSLCKLLLSKDITPDTSHASEGTRLPVQVTSVAPVRASNGWPALGFVHRSYCSAGASIMITGGVEVHIKAVLNRDDNNA